MKFLNNIAIMAICLVHAAHGMHIVSAQADTASQPKVAYIELTELDLEW